MNKANKFKLRTYSHNQNILRLRNNEHFSKTINDQNKIQSIHKRNKYQQNKLQSTQIKRFSTQPSTNLDDMQIQPFSQIQNLMGSTMSKIWNQNRLWNQPQHNATFIKTKKAKLYPKQKKSFRQNQSVNQWNSKNGLGSTNFQSLKKEIINLQNLQILKPSYYQKTNNTQDTLNPQKYYQQPNQTCSQYIVNKQFSIRKDISLIQRHRQNIKKVNRNRKFRSYLNLTHKDQVSISKKQFDNQYKITKSYNQYGNFNPNQTKTQLYKGKNLDTPQIIKKYYRPQSCNVKRQRSLKGTKSFQLQAKKYIDSIKINKKSKQKLQIKSLSLDMMLSTKNSNSNRSPGKKKELIIICV